MEGLRRMLKHRQNIPPRGVLDTLVPIMPKKFELMIDITESDFNVPRRLILRSTSSILAHM